jgi:hypothetical protein
LKLRVAPAAALVPAGFFMRGRLAMLGWIALTLILWLVAAMRMVAGARLDARSLKPDPVIPAQAAIHAAFGEVGESRKTACRRLGPEAGCARLTCLTRRREEGRESADETKTPSLNVLRHPELVSGSSWSPAQEAPDWMLKQVQHDGRKRATSLQRHTVPTFEPPPTSVGTWAEISAGRTNFPGPSS